MTHLKVSDITLIVNGKWERLIKRLEQIQTFYVSSHFEDIAHEFFSHYSNIMLEKYDSVKQNFGKLLSII